MSSSDRREGDKDKGDKSIFKTPTTPSKIGPGYSGKKGRRRTGEDVDGDRQEASGNGGPRRLSQEEIVDQMEKEQDAIVMRLLREIEMLREENGRLRRNMAHLLNGEPLSPTPPQSRRSSLASMRQSQLFGTPGSLASTPSSSRRSSFSQMDILKSDLQKKRNSACSYPTVSSCASSSAFSSAIYAAGKHSAYEYVDGAQSAVAGWGHGGQEVMGGGAGLGQRRNRRRRPSNEPATGGAGVRISKVANRTGSPVL